MDLDDLSRPFERTPTKLVSIDPSTGQMRSYEATAGGAPKLRETAEISDREAVETFRTNPHNPGGSLPA
jgi:hypothetical protein